MLSTDYFEADTHLTARVPIEVGSSDVDDVAVHLDSGFAVTGRVRIESKSGNAPIYRQFVLNLRSSDPRAGFQIKWSADNATFTIPDLTPGNYRLDAVPPSPYYVKSVTLAGRDFMREEIPITQSGAGPIDIVLSDDGGVIDAQVTGADDQPVAAAGVMLLQNGLRPRIAATGPDGHVKLQGLAPGDYRIYAWDDVQQVEYADAEWMKRNGGSGVAVTVQAGQTAQVTVKEQTVPAQ
jgi:hypothetical protein